MSLISGCSGFVSRHLCKSLSEQGHIVHGLDKVKPEKNIGLDTFIEMDLCELDKPGDYRWLEGYDYIFHLAAETALGTSENWLVDVNKFYKVNTKATLNLLKYSDPTKFIFTSTAALYGEGNFFKETDAVKCNNGYGFSKAVAETIIVASGKPYCIFRPGTIVGPWGRSVLNRFTYDCVKGKTSNVFNHGYNKRSFIDVQDVVSGLIAGMDLSGTFNLASSDGSKVGDVMDYIAEVGREYGYLYDFKTIDNIPDGLAKCVTLDNSKLIKTGKWKPVIESKQMIERLFDHYVKRKCVVEPPEWR